MNESRAIRLCLNDRDSRGFEFLVEKYRSEAFFHAFTLLGNKDEARDACQDSFSKAYSAMLRLTRLTSFYPWFYRILRNTCINMLARKKTATDYLARHGKIVNQQAKPESPSEYLEKKETTKRIHDVLTQLKREQREILVMKHFNQWSYADIAGVLDIPRGTVMSRLHNARRAFREQYEVELHRERSNGN